MGPRFDSKGSVAGRWPAALTLLLALLWVAPWASGLAPRSQGPDLDAARARWAELDPSERRLLSERFRQYQELSPEARQALERRALELRRHRDRLVERLPAEWWDQGPGRAARGRADRACHHTDPFLRGWQREGARFDGRSLERRLPRELRERLEAAAPGERPLVIETWRNEREARFLERALVELRASLELAPERVEALRAMDLETRRAELLALRREHLRRQVAAGTAGGFLEPERWAALENLGDREFFAAWREEARLHFAQRIETLRGAFSERGATARGSEPRPELLEALETLLDGPDGRRARLALLRPEPGEGLAESLARHPRLTAEARRVLLDAEAGEVLEALWHLAPRRPSNAAEEPGGPLRRPGMGPRPPRAQTPPAGDPRPGD